MSVTFFITGAPTAKVTKPCEACDGTGTEERAGYPESSCPYCNGSGTYETYEYVAPFFDMNLSNANAMDLVRLLDPEHTFDGSCGEWPVERLPRIARNIIRAQNLAKERTALVLPSVREGNIVHCGRDEEYVVQRLAQFADLVKLATERGASISFS